MTQAAIPSETVYALAGANLGPFSTVWGYALDAEVTVFVDFADGAGPQLQALTVGYALADNPPTLANGGAVTLTSALLPAAGAWTAGSTLSLKRATALSQPSAFGEAAEFSPAASEGAMDNLDREIQDQAATLKRALVTRLGEAGFNLPAAAARANRLMGFSASGQVALTDPATLLGPAVLELAAAASGATVIAGAVGDGATDNYLVIQAALNAAGAIARTSGSVTASGTQLILGPGVFCIGHDIYIPTGVELKGMGPFSTLLQALPTFTFTGGGKGAVNVQGTPLTARVSGAGLTDIGIDPSRCYDTAVPGGSPDCLYVQAANFSLKLNNVAFYRPLAAYALHLDGDVFETEGDTLFFTASVSVQPKGGIYCASAVNGVNDNRFTNLFFTGYQTASRIILDGGTEAQGNTFANIADEAGQNGAPAIRITGGNWNTIEHYRVYDPSFALSPQPVIVIEQVLGAGGYYNVIDDIDLSYPGAFCAINFKGAAAYNQVTDVNPIQASGAGGLVYCEASAGNNRVSGRGQGVYATFLALGVGGGLAVGSAPLSDYESLSSGFAPRLTLVGDILGRAVNVNIGATFYPRPGNFEAGYNETGANLLAGQPVTYQFQNVNFTVFQWAAAEAADKPIGLAGLAAPGAPYAAAGAFTTIKSHGQVPVPALNATSASVGQRVYADGAGGLSLTAPPTGPLILAGFVAHNTSPAEVMAYANFAPEIARSRLGMQRFTADPALAQMAHNEFAVGVTGAGAANGKLYFCDMSYGGGSGETLTASLGISQVLPTAGGAGYVTPIVTVHDPTGVGATAAAVLASGQIVGYTVTAPGTGYTAPTISIADAGGGAGAAAVASMGVAAVAVVAGGAGYVNAATLFFKIAGGGGSGADLVGAVAAGAIASVTPRSLGQNYTSLPTITAYGGGTGGILVWTADSVITA